MCYVRTTEAKTVEEVAGRGGGTLRREQVKNEISVRGNNVNNV